MLTKDPSAREEYRRYLELHAMLQFEYSLRALIRARGSAANQPIDVSSAVGGQQSVCGRRPAAPSPRETFLRRFLGDILSARDGESSLPKLSALVAAAMLVGSGLTLWLTGWTSENLNGRAAVAHRGDGHTSSLDQPAEITPVAYLTSANGCAWGGDSLQAWAVGHSVELGSELALNEGIAEFRLANGVSFSLEGPSSLLLVSPSKLVLQYGRLTAYVPWGSDDLQVIAAGCLIVAQDAEFGVNLKEGKLYVHAFTGEVTASSTISSHLDAAADAGFTDAENENYFTSAVITAGRAVGVAAFVRGARIARRRQRIVEGHAAGETAICPPDVQGENVMLFA